MEKREGMLTSSLPPLQMRLPAVFTPAWIPGMCLQCSKERLSTLSYPPLEIYSPAITLRFQGRSGFPSLNFSEMCRSLLGQAFFFPLKFSFTYMQQGDNKTNLP